MNKHKFNLYPELSGQEYEKLRESIAAGYDKTFPVVLFQNAVLDGWNRYRACKELGIVYTEKQFNGTDAEALAFVIRSNERRDLDKSKRACLAVEYEPVFARMAKERQRGGQGGVLLSQKFEQANKIKATEQAGALFSVNRQYVSDAKRLKAENPELYNKVMTEQDYGLQDAKKEEKEKKKQERIIAEKSNRKKEVSEIEIRKGDFATVLDDVINIDAIITDPPYPKEYLDEFSKLSLFASTHLKQDGFCAIYSGQYNLPEVIKRLSEYLTYVWTFCLYHVGKKQLVNGVNIMCGWKPVLIFSTGKKKMRFSAYDVLVSEQREKESHEWQQSESGVKSLIEIFSLPGNLIVDPFAGSGTFLKVAHEMGRETIGAEINE